MFMKEGKKEQTCSKCGNLYDAEIYKNECPQCGYRDVDTLRQQREEDLSELQIAHMYGPRPISNYETYRKPLTGLKATLYGPLPGYFQNQKSWRKRFQSIVIFIIGGLFGGIIVWLFLRN